MSGHTLTTRPLPHAARIGLVTAFAAALLAWLVGHTDILFADGLRYIEQARRLDRGDWLEGAIQAVDHPLYPLAVAVAHRALPTAEGPVGWQFAAQAASAIAGVLLVVPLYLVARELFGGSSAWLACLLVYLVPVPSRVMADALSEGTFLLFWTWGLWAALNYLRAGSVVWLAPALLGGGLAYLARPEGLLLPAALVATLGLIPLIPPARLPARLWWSAVLTLGVGAACVVGPFVAVKGGIGTKPAVARLLGLAPPSKPDAVERERPLDPSLSTPALYGQAVRAAGGSIGRAVTFPLLPFAGLGLIAAVMRRGRAGARGWVFLGVVVVGSVMALIRLYATGGYCTPRHALIVALPLLAASASGLRVVAAGLVRLTRGPSRLAGAVPVAAALVLTLPGLPDLLAPVNASVGGYRDAGNWLAGHVGPGDRVADVTGWSLFYGSRPGYVFANLHEAAGDRSLRWVVAREAHLRGPWGYCARLRNLVAGARTVARFPAERQPGQSQVTIYERSPPRPVETATPGESPMLRR